MDFQKILENKPLLYGIIGGIVILLAVFVTIGAVVAKNNNGGKGAARPVSEKVIKEPLELFSTDNIGKAIEVQSLLAREGIVASRKVDGTKSVVYLKEYTMPQRDQALLAIVKSGLVDQNVGLEIFDKGDFTSTKEDKKIRLARAINGELSRLIRKIPPIENASVFISIPEDTMFTTMKKPVTATVQVSIPVGDKLDPLKVKAITNLLLGSVSGLETDNISITDTNGNVYSSMMDVDDEMLTKLQENDKYMQQKVGRQLDRLIGAGNYTATVSTFLRQAPMERTRIEYDPNQKTAVSEQSFTEGLGDQTRDTNKNPNAVSVYVPNGLAAGGQDSSQDRSYSRSATETQYGVTKTQTNEYIKPGIVEEISIAVTMDKSAMPPETTVEELKELIARSASPKALPENVTIAFSDVSDLNLAGDRQANLPKPDESGNPWWITIALCIIGLVTVSKIVQNKIRKAQEEHEKEVAALKQKEMEQDKLLQEMNARAAQLTERQSELAQGLLEAQQREYLALHTTDELVNALANMSANISEADEEIAADKIKSWIEET
ncbi:hypothetical protein KID03_05700 [bacterium]|nr:hypothetical protein [bacterium]